MPLVSVTRLRVRSLRYLPGFLYYVMRSSMQAQKAAGNLNLNLLREANRTFWTGTVWENEEAMRAFMMSGSHRKAMTRLPHWCDEAAVVHWSQENASLPDWREAHRRMVSEGRRPKVFYPSSDQKAGIIAPPGISARAVG